MPAGLKLCEITGYYAGSSLVRIVVAGWNDLGRKAVEYYLPGDDVFFLYESFEYLPEKAPAGAWKNFKGLPGWERRVGVPIERDSARHAGDLNGLLRE